MGVSLPPQEQQRQIRPPAVLPFTGLAGAPDHWVAEMVRQGDSRAFEQIMLRYREPLYRYCYGITGHQQDAEEALQVTMINAFSALKRMDRPVVLRPWLYRIARNVCIDLVRGRPNWTALTAVAEPAGDDLGERHEVHERFEGLRRDLAGLDELHRSALLLRELNGLSLREIGDTLGTSSESAKRLIFEARETLTERAAGRDLACGDVRARISERDGRMLRSRRISTHLDECAACAAFRDGLRSRPRQLASLFPALPAGAAARLLEALGGAGAVGGVGGLALLGGGGGFALLGGLSGQTAALLAVAAVGGSVMVPAMVSGETTSRRGAASGIHLSPTPQGSIVRTISATGDSAAGTPGATGGSPGAQPAVEVAAAGDPDPDPVVTRRTAPIEPVAGDDAGTPAPTVAPGPDATPAVAPEPVPVAEPPAAPVPAPAPTPRVQPPRTGTGTPGAAPSTPAAPPVRTGGTSSVAQHPVAPSATVPLTTPSNPAPPAPTPSPAAGKPDVPGGQGQGQGQGAPGGDGTPGKGPVGVTSHGATDTPGPPSGTPADPPVDPPGPPATPTPPTPPTPGPGDGAGTPPTSTPVVTPGTPGAPPGKQPRPPAQKPNPPGCR